MKHHQHLDLNYLNTMAADDEELKKELMVMLLDEMGRCLPEMRRFWNAEQWFSLQQLCHHTKSTLIYCGNQIVIQANAALEEGLKDNSKKKALLAHLEKMETFFPIIMQELKVELEQV
ncbi:MAG TPA: hypothetical protein PKA00_23560 [Saprospiraceae bacterium]|nr:hypothetical protein [Saprospiraceae bacterium]HMQ85907.1 hypothetical protein [Saprospiraceae bacterium]